MTTSTNDSLESQDGDLTSNQLTDMLNAGLHGDTSGSTGDEGGAPATTTDAAKDTPAKADPVDKSIDAPSDSELSPANTRVLAKDGVHTISFEKFQAHRDGEREWRQRAQAAEQEAAQARQALADAQAQSQARQESGQQATTKDKLLDLAQEAVNSGADVSLFGDFSEEAITQGIQKLNSQGRTEMRKELREELLSELRQELAPVIQQHQSSAAQAHFEQIAKAHADAGSIAESAEFDAWIKAQPSYAQEPIRLVLDQGSSAQVIELLDQYKAATGHKSQQERKPDAAAKAVVDNLQLPAPSSLSDIPGGRGGAQTMQERLDSLHGVDLFNAFNEMSDDAVDSFLRRKS